MKKSLLFIIVISLVISCGKSHEGNMLVKGNIDGLKKGTLYLQKIKDTLLITVDSIQLKGESNFILSDNVESPEMYYITLGEISNEKMAFFGEEGEITVSSKLAKLVTSLKITGSSNQVVLDEYKAMIQKFNGKQLDLIKAKFDAMKDSDSEAQLETEVAERNLIKRRYLYTTNFALTHADTEVAPYLALTELYNANIKLLDTINNSLSEKIKISKYGSQLNDFVQKIKSQDN
ncbi:MAG: DUF4369 domain-containing protein [Bacteroidetes bacterium]|nr:DUF4369 domain-containing protein [Bacteroidota bacterium]